MPGDSFIFKEFEIKQGSCAMKVGTDAVLLGAWCNLPRTGNILDIGTGTGIIAMMAAQRSNALLDAIEIDEGACGEALENCQKSKWADRITIFPVSLQKFVLSATKKYDVIVSNPPYFSNSLPAASEPRTIARHTCNLSFLELADGVVSLLKKDGLFATILPSKEAADFTAIAKRTGLFPCRLSFVKTTSLKPVKRILMEFGFHKINPVEETIIIENEDHNYSNEYKKLTGSFYLGF